MKTFSSYFMASSENYEPVNKYDGIADTGSCCAHCGQAYRSLRYSSEKLLRYACILLVLALTVSLSMIIRGTFQDVAHGKEKLPFLEIFGESQ